MYKAAPSSREENKLNFLNFDAKLDYYIFAARARGKSNRGRAHPELEPRLKRQRQSRVFLPAQAFLMFLFFPQQSAYLSTP
jgi:hypothetical protein